MNHTIFVACTVADTALWTIGGLLPLLIFTILEPGPTGAAATKCFLSLYFVKSYPLFGLLIEDVKACGIGPSFVSVAVANSD